MSALYSLLRMPRRQRNLLWRATFALLLVRVALWLLPSKRILERARQLIPSSRRRMNAPDVRTLVWSVEAISRRLPGSTCLSRALAAQRLLARWGYASELCLGVARSDRELRAHAWLERQGEIVVGASAEPYTLLT